MADKVLRLGMWQDSGILGDIAANLALIERAAGRAAADGIDLLVFPECFLTGYFSAGRAAEIAEGLSDNTFAALEKIAKAHGVALVVGTYEKADGRLHNSALFIAPEGGVIGRHRKRALYGDWEKTTFEPGNSAEIVTYNGVRIGLLICYDVEFPELTRELAQQGADLIVVPTALMEPYDFVAQHIVATRAVENQLFVAYANRVGEENGQRYLGMSCLHDPGGVRLLSGPRGESALLTADVKIGDVAEARRDFCYLDDLARL